MKHQIQLDLVIYGFDVDPDQITSFLAIQPSVTWRKGDRIGTSALKRKHNGWSLSSGLNKTDDFDQHLNAIIRTIEPSIGKFSSLPAAVEVELSCAVSLREDSPESLPAIYFQAQAVSVLAKLKAEIDFDLYLLPAK